jgi:nucleoid-associated protein YgaU
VGGYGDFDYSLEMRWWRDFRTYAEPERLPGLEATASGEIVLTGLAPETTTLEGGGNRPDPGPPASYLTTQEDADRSDTALWDLALRFYGDGNRWPDLYFANQDAIGPDSNVLPAGIDLIVPQ